jgi:hypothetical protein
MFNLSDKELDRLSRKAADSYEVENNTSSWDALEQQLDKELGSAPNPSVPSPRSFTLPFAYTSLIILLVGSTYFLLKSGKNSNDVNKKNYSVTSKQQSTTDNNSLKEASETTGDKNKIAIAPDANSITNNKKISDLDKLSEEKISSTSTKKDNAKKDFSTDLKKNNLSQKNNVEKTENETAADAGENNLANNKSSVEKSYSANNNKNAKDFYYHNKKTFKDKPITQRNSENNEDESRNNIAKEKEAKDYSLNSGKIANNKPIQKPAEEQDLKYASTSQTKQSAEHSFIIINDSSLRAETGKINARHIIDLNKKNSRSLNTNRSLQIGFSIAPDFSQVNHAHYDNRLGNSIGITLGYRLFKRLSINTGFIYAHKYFQADDENFHLKPGAGLPPNLHAEYMNGSAKMIEIPLNIRYDVSTQGNTTFFVNGGLSSYLIKKQDNLYYCRNYNNIGMSGWLYQSYNVPQNFWFSTINLSAGFETNISNTVSFQFEPYIKIPLKALGVGNVQLSSYGINFVIKFSPVLKRSRH